MKIVPWISEEARHFLESARSDADPHHAAYVLVLVLGMRTGDVLGLWWGAIDSDLRELTADHQLQRVRRELLYGDQDGRFGRFASSVPDIVSTALALRRAEQEAARVEGRRNAAAVL